ncbi:MAG TPA: serine/threonine-protein kinase [Polyangiaceae bacterium]
MGESSTLRSSDPTGYSTGDVIAEKYRLVRFLAEGAQGSVWLAENLALGSEVAIKLVHGEPSNAAPTLRLEKEARVAAQIGHAAVVRVFDLGRTSQGDAFIVMEFLQGENLGERLTACGRLSPVETVRTLLPIADVLHVAHARGIVHRDVKPENVFLAKSGSVIQPKLLDFGIAKHRGLASSESVITDVGALVGSPAYLSPEQAVCREDIGRAADLWSFCVVLYECVTGALPFDSENCHDLFRKIGEDAPAPMLAHGVGDFELWEIVRRGLAKAPEDRWPDMHSLGRALAGWLRARGIQDDLSGMRLDSKWLARGRTEPAAAFDAVESSSVRCVKKPDAVDARLPATVRAASVRSPSRWLLTGGIVAALVPAALGYGFASSRSGGDTPSVAKQQTPTVRELAAAPLGAAAPLAAAAATAAPKPTVVPPPAAPSPSTRTPMSALPAPRRAQESREPAATTQKKRRSSLNADLIDPY